jgi:hypothetical protein
MAIGVNVGPPIVAAAAFQAASSDLQEASVFRKGRLKARPKGDCGQDCPPHRIKDSRPCP